MFFQRLLEAGLRFGAQLAHSFMLLCQPGHGAAQALQLSGMVFAAQTIEVFLGGTDVALMTLKFFLYFLWSKSMP